ncbi:hypothetical protein TL16_g02707 [Triparma laevis f. inornata]|uniref:Uncharacterized protein n=2 Tax=Triparma laevis TaxID=1534972 RepID=A0A9W6ZYY1_9STRA|nr:hypothetical protein TL16_g02707 [Triparma laevis f. inornata]GMH60991.1 hypothetical protein TrLO_g13663 [Triparma laevis f. longispina]
MGGCMSAPKSEASDKAAPLPSDCENNGNVSKVKPAAMTLPEDGSQPENVMMAGVTPAHKTKPEQPKLWG